MAPRAAVVVGIVLAASAGIAPAEQEPARKDAAQTVGEGNTSRWLEFYRRERGQDWNPPPAEEAPKGADKEAPRPSDGPAESPPRR